VQALQARPRYAHFLLTGAPVVAVLHLQIRIFDNCAQAPARSAAVWGERLVETHPFSGVATEQPSPAAAAAACGQNTELHCTARNFGVALL
jgi:hypothetical protein